MAFASFHELHVTFREDARDAYIDLVERRPGERVCAFALVTDDDVMGASAAGDTTERRDERLAARPPSSASERRYHQWAYAWNTGEWDNIYSKEQPKTRPSRVSAEEYFYGMMSFQETWTSQPGNSERKFRRYALRAMVDALAELDSEGLFGTGREREEITIFVEITDSNDCDAVKLQTARRLNPQASAARLRASLPLRSRLLVTATDLIKSCGRGKLIARRAAE